MDGLDNIFGDDEEGGKKKGLIFLVIVFIGIFLFNFVGARNESSRITVKPRVVSENGNEWLEVSIQGHPQNYEISMNRIENRIYQVRLWVKTLLKEEMKENKGSVLFKLGERLDRKKTYSLEIESIQRGNPINWFFTNPPIYENKIEIQYEVVPDR